MEKHKIVKFTDGLAKVYITDDYTPFLDQENVFVNPDLSYVMGVSPEFWTLKDGIIWPLENEELERRRDVMEIQTSLVQKTEHKLVEELLFKIENNQIESDKQFEEVYKFTIYSKEQCEDLKNSIIQNKQLFDEKLENLEYNTDAYNLHLVASLQQMVKKQAKVNKLLLATIIIMGIIGFLK